MRRAFSLGFNCKSYCPFSAHQSVPYCKSYCPLTSQASIALRDYNRALVLEHPRINFINFFNFFNFPNLGFSPISLFAFGYQELCLADDVVVPGLPTVEHLAEDVCSLGFGAIW